MAKKILETPYWFKILWAEFEATHIEFEKITGYSRVWWKATSQEARKEIMAKMNPETFKKMNDLISYANSVKGYALEKYRYENRELVGDADCIGVNDEGQLYAENIGFDIKEMLGNFIGQLKERFGGSVKAEVIEEDRN